MKPYLILTLTLIASSSVFFFQDDTTERIRLQLGDTTIKENGETVIEIGGKCGSGQLLAFHLPEKGWYVTSVEPFPGYDFQKIGRLDGNVITFQYDNRSYEITSDQPISPQVNNLDLWVVRITPPADKAHAGGKTISCATNFKYWLETTFSREEKR